MTSPVPQGSWLPGACPDGFEPALPLPDPGLVLLLRTAVIGWIGRIALVFVAVTALGAGCAATVIHIAG